MFVSSTYMIYIVWWVWWVWPVWSASKKNRLQYTNTKKWTWYV